MKMIVFIIGLLVVHLSLFLSCCVAESQPISPTPDPAKISQLTEGLDAAPLVPPLTFLSHKSPQKKEPIRFHPPVILLDEQSNPVIQSSAPLSLMKTCGACHDTDFIEKHNYHAQAGLNEMNAITGPYRPWDSSPGMFGRWNPLTYRVLTTSDAELFDMGTADWIRIMGPRHVGGGPAQTSRYTGGPLTDYKTTVAVNPDTHVLNPVTGKPIPWDWQASGTVELNCLLCHLDTPDNVNRIREIQSGRFKWASTATLLNTGIVSRSGDQYLWDATAFKPDGTTDMHRLRVRDPQSNNCRQCHGKACRCSDPVVFMNSVDNWSTETTGEVFSPEPINRSGMNLHNKPALNLPWDLHAQRLLQCTNCHYSLNNPEYNDKASDENRPGHLKFDARRFSLSGYLNQPDHNFAKGFSAQGTVAHRFQGTMRSCEDCHDAQATHDWLPYKSLHFEKLSCQACHIPQVYAPARKMTDWTAIHPDGTPLKTYRGVQGEINKPESLITGYQPILLQLKEGSMQKLKPFNLMTSFFWTAGTPPSPVRQVDLLAAYLDSSGTYHYDILKLFDYDHSGSLSDEELRLDNSDKMNLIRKHLEALGLIHVQIRGEIQPYSLSHGVARGDFAMLDCRKCHSYDSRINTAFSLAEYIPAGVMPVPVRDSQTLWQGSLDVDSKEGLYFQSNLDPTQIYVHGTDRLKWLDWLGIIAVVGVIFGAGAHGGLRLLFWRNRRKRW